MLILIAIVCQTTTTSLRSNIVFVVALNPDLIWTWMASLPFRWRENKSVPSFNASFPSSVKTRAGFAVSSAPVNFSYAHFDLRALIAAAWRCEGAAILFLGVFDSGGRPHDWMLSVSRRFPLFEAIREAKSYDSCVWEVMPTVFISATSCSIIKSPPCLLSGPSPNEIHFFISLRTGGGQRYCNSYIYRMMAAK